MPYALVLLRNFPVIQEFVFQYADLTETQHMASTAHNERQVFNLSLRFDLQLMLSLIRCLPFYSHTTINQRAIQVKGSSI